MKLAILILALALSTAAAEAGGPASSPAADTGAPRFAEGYVSPRPKEGYSYPECYCTDSSGKRVEVGQMACLQIGSRQVTSRCEKARNLVIWRHQVEGCAPGV